MRIRLVNTEPDSPESSESQLVHARAAVHVARRVVFLRSGSDRDGWCRAFLLERDHDPASDAG